MSNAYSVVWTTGIRDGFIRLESKTGFHYQILSYRKFQNRENLGFQSMEFRAEVEWRVFETCSVDVDVS